MSSLVSNINKAFGPQWPNNDFTIRLSKHFSQYPISAELLKGLQPAQIINNVRSESQSRKDGLWEHFEEAMVRAIYGSNMIESAGSSLKITDNLCRAVFRGKEVSAEVADAEGHPEYETHVKALLDANRKTDKSTVIQSRQEIINHAKAINYMFGRVICKGESLSEDAIRETHRILSAGFVHDDLVPGEYRTTEVAVRYGVRGKQKTAPCMRASAVPKRMTKMVADLENELAAAEHPNSLDPYTLAARYHHIFVMIHPFADGNGRVSRIILNVLLLKYAGHVCVIGDTAEDRALYLRVVRKAARDFHNEDGEVEYHEETSHFAFANYVLARSKNNLVAMLSWLN